MSYETIVVGHGPSATAAEAMGLAALLARPGARVTIADVCEFDPIVPRIGLADWHRYLVEQAEQRLANVSDATFASGVEIARTVVTRSTATRGLHDVAEQVDADLIVLGSSQRGTLGRILAGGTAESLLRAAPCAVAVAPRGYEGGVGGRLATIGVGYDGSPEADAALDAAAQLARESDAALRVVAVTAPPAVPAAGVPFDLGEAELELLEQLTSDKLGQALGRVGADVRADGVQRRGSPATALADEAASGLDLLVVGSRAYGPLRRALLGSVSAALMRTAPCPLLVTPRGAVEPSAPSAEAAAGG